MKLYLVRHGDNNAVDIDPDKNLSEQGRKDLAKVADVLKNAAVFVEEIYHSGIRRSIQTAEILAGAVQLNGKIKEHDFLKPNDPAEKMAHELEERNADLMIVGHLPYLGKLASYLLSGLEQSDLIEFERGSVLCLERFNRKWQVKWMLVTDLF
jgi:phosphohistidine phosphatase